MITIRLFVYNDIHRCEMHHVLFFNKGIKANNLNSHLHPTLFYPQISVFSAQIMLEVK